MAFFEAQEDGQIDVALELDPQLVDLNSAHGRVGHVPDGQAAAERAEHLLDRIGCTVGSSQQFGLVGVGRRQVADPDLVPETALPDDLRPPDRVARRRVFREMAGQCLYLLDVDAVNDCAHAHDKCSPESRMLD